MRHAARALSGYYPAPPEAVSAITARIMIPTHPVAILDPCAGQGAAIHQIADDLSVSSANVYAVELDEGRAVDVKERLAGANVLAPCSFFGASVTPQSFSFAWVNPPFDDEIGGGNRVEETFLFRAAALLKTNGVVALVCPDRVAQNWRMQEAFISSFRLISIVEFPDHVRKFDEVVMLGVKRPATVQPWKHHIKNEMAPEEFMYSLPESAGPKVWAKHSLTDGEIARLIERSPLRRMFDPPKELPLPRPAMSLGAGHIAFLVASGHVDGIVRPDGEPPHVVRGSARKEQYLASTDTSVNEEGEVTTKSVYSEKMLLTIRTVDQEGRITTYE